MGSLSREFRDATGRVVDDMPLSGMLDEQPNMLQTGDEFWSSLTYRAALAGMAFAEPVNGPFGVEIWPLAPHRTQVDWEDRGFTVIYLPERGPVRYIKPVDLFWISGLSDACARPLTPWKMARGSIDFALALEHQGRSFFQNAQRIAGVLESDHKLSPEGIERLKVGIGAWISGKTPVLEQGLTYKDVASNNSDAQMVELIKQRTLELARYWHIPKSMIGEDGGSKANQEQQALEYVKYCIRPWARRIEQAVNRRLLTPDQRARWSMKLNLDALLRGDSATQWRNAVLARTSGILSRNAIATGWFNEPRIEEPWADDPREPLNSNRAADTVSGGETAPQDQITQGRTMVAGDILPLVPSAMSLDEHIATLMEVED